ncbi:MAG TPA: FG-GAP-like repeat-containing protein [Thermoanaerobaculia bacterium]|nr:FG-GAP-like repeat-containing protein [Thermoanaerobaculia bacterium]
MSLSLLRRVLFLSLFAAPAVAVISYGPPTFPGTGSGPMAIVVGDFNGDCNPDFATANSATADGVTIRFGNGTGGFPTSATLTGQVDAESIAAGDFNGDGFLDLAVGNVGGFTLHQNFIQIYLNDGAGVFSLQPATVEGVNSRAQALLAVDFNEDGQVDLVAPDAAAFSGVKLFLGNGNGTFSAGTHIDVQSPVSSGDAFGLAAADLDGDGHLDLVSANGATLSWLFGNGNGTFGAPQMFTYPAPQGELGAVDVTSGDLDHDGDLDLATVGGNVAAGASVFLNNGAGVFSRTQFSMPQAPANPVSVTLADLDGDGNLDIVTANQSGCTPWGSNLAARPGNGNGTFGAAIPISIGYGPTCLDSHWQPNDAAAVDLNCDGKMDLITPNLSTSFASVILTPGGADNSAPVIHVPANVTAPADATCSAFVSDGQIGAATATDNCGCALITRSGVPAGNIFPLGATTITWTATDASNNQSSGMQTVTVTASAPTISGLSASPNPLWQPNHKMVTVTVDYTLAGGCGNATCGIISVTSNEPDNGLGDGDMPNDIEIVDAHHVKLRAERAGGGSGRVYTITVGCGPASATVTVAVPRNK